MLLPIFEKEVFIIQGLHVISFCLDVYKRQEYSHFTERVDGGHTVTSGVAEQNTVFHMDAS